MADQTGTKGIRVSRRKLLLGAGVGVVLGANVLIIRARNAQNKPRSIDLGFQGPFSYEQELCL